MTQSNVCRWGFLGTAAIARKNWKAVRLSGNGRVAAVASRSLDRAKAFVDQCSHETPQVEPVAAIGSYNELLENPNIDAVYIPLPTGLRKQYVIAAAEAGKHVLSEKPFAVNVADAREMIDACKMANVQLMDGVMFDHGQRIERVRHKLLDRKTLGQLRRIQTHFSFPTDDSFSKSNIRANHELEPHGCVGDLGWYCIRFTLWISGWQLPKRVSARTLRSIGSDNGNGGRVPSEFSAEMVFKDGLSASFYCSFLTANQQTATVSGSDGYLTLGDFVLPFYDGQAHWSTHRHDLEIDNCRWNFRKRSSDAASDEYASGESNSQEVNMVRQFAQRVTQEKLDTRYSEWILKTQTIVDACRQSAVADGQWVEVEGRKS